MARASECRTIKAGAVTLSGTLITSDGGKTWHQGGDVTVAKGVAPAMLIEGSIAWLGAERLLQVFRSSSGKIYTSLSRSGGRRWEPAEPIKLPNPNSKIAVAPLPVPPGTSPHAHRARVVMGYNHHDKLAGELLGARSHLRVAVSLDSGEHWNELARLEEEPAPKMKQHYPTLLPMGECSVAVVYTIGLKERASEGGVRVALIDFNARRGAGDPDEAADPTLPDTLAEAAVHGDS